MISALMFVMVACDDNLDEGLTYCTPDFTVQLPVENDAKQARRRIIVFSDECRRGMLHSSEHFDSILDDITFYRQYCDDHPKFRNEKAAHSIKYIDDVYDKTKRENAFI